MVNIQDNNISVSQLFTRVLVLGPVSSILIIVIIIIMYRNHTPGVINAFVC